MIWMEFGQLRCISKAFGLDIWKRVLGILLVILAYSQMFSSVPFSPLSFSDANHPVLSVIPHP
jgi:hypothetical protein